MAVLEKSTLARRSVLLGLAATTFGGTALAGGGGGGGDGGGGINIGNRAPKVKTKYSQNEFVNLSKGEIFELYLDVIGKKKIEITGFSRQMSSLLITMADGRRRVTYRLVREMAKLKTKKDRRARLDRELEKTYKEMADLAGALNRALNKGRKAAASETKERISELKTYQNGIKHWRNNLSEGTR